MKKLKIMITIALLVITIGFGNFVKNPASEPEVPEITFNIDKDILNTIV